MILLVGCSAYQVAYDRKPGTDFSKYRTYAWLPPDSVNGKFFNKQYINDRVMYYSNQQLSSKGMSIDKNKPDALFHFYTYTEYQIEYQYNPPPATVNFGFGGPGYYMGYAAPLAPATITQKTYQVGTLVMEMYDPSGNDVLWRGIVSKALDRSPDIDAELSQAIKRMFYSLPLRPLVKD
ncbi:MAG: DUF4136 domain-containing protein [Bacteroidota bacterium]